MSFQTTNPNKNAYLNNNCLVLINKDTNEDVDMMDYVQKTFNYTVQTIDTKQSLSITNTFLFSMKNITFLMSVQLFLAVRIQKNLFFLLFKRSQKLLLKICLLI